MSERQVQGLGAPKHKRRRRRVRLLPVLSLMVMFLAGALGWVALSGTPITAPVWVTQKVEKALNDSFQGAGRVSVGGVEIAVQQMVPRVRLRNVGIFDARGVETARLNQVGARLVAPALLKGNVEMDALRVSGAQITVRRLSDGTFDLTFGSGGRATGSLGAVLDGIDAAFTKAPLAQLKELSALDLTISLEDARSGRIWQVTGGRIDLTHAESAMRIRVTAEVFNGTENLASTVIEFQTEIGTPEATLFATFENAAAADIAAQSPALTFLNVIEAPISGTLSGSFDADGTLGVLSGSLEIGEGVFQPTPEVEPVPIESAGAQFSYDANERRMDFEALTLQTAAARGTGSGQAFLQDFRGDWPETMVAQLQLTDVVVQPKGVFAEPMTFDSGALDYRVRLDPFTLEIGQLALIEDGRRAVIDGNARADASGWHLALDIELDSFPLVRVLALWPVQVAGEVRNWLGRNITDAVISNLAGGFRLSPEDPDGQVSVSFNYASADIKPMKTLPPITNAAGYASLVGSAFSAVLEAGTVTPPEGGEIDVAGSVFRVPDVTIQPGQAEVTVKTDSPITAALSLLNMEPLSILKNTDLPVSMADGRAKLRADLAFPLLDKVDIKDISYSVMGSLERVYSDQIIPDRELRAGYLEMQAGPYGVAISGRATLGAVPANVVWSQEFGPEAKGSRVDGTIVLDQAFLEEFGIALPPGSVSGEGEGKLAVTLPPEGAPEFTLTSDLDGIGMRLPALGWAMGAGQTGTLEVVGKLGPEASVDTITLGAPGLFATGAIDLNTGGSLAQARFERVRVGNWMDGAVTLIGRGGASPSILVSGGQVDLRAADFGGAGGSGGGGSGGNSAGPLTLQLDRLIVSEGIAFTDFTGQFTSHAGFQGRFAARINGATPVTGTIVPTPSGAAVRLISEDAGGALASAGILRNARGGMLDLTLNPTRRAGTYNGRLSILRTRIIRAPAMTELLSAISVVGLLDQLNTGGISMSEIEAEFQLSPSRLTLLRSSGVGPSLGISLDGVYDLAGDRIDMQGVISPVYFLNGIGQVFSRRGEGVFGFNFRLRGASDNPSVSVNPLSILTPGMFREIFRRPPPQPG